MFQNIIRLLKLFEFRYYTGLALDNELEFVHPQQKQKSTIGLNWTIHFPVLESYRNTQKQTQLYANSIAHMMCQFMALAYEDEQTIVQSLQSIGQLVYKIDSTIIIWFKEYNLVVLCFAGTKSESLNDWWINITGSHQQEWNKQRSKIITYLNRFKDSYIAVCGHSKGGIMSILAYNDTGLSIDTCYIAGVPDYFAKSDKSVGIYSIKNRGDPVSEILGSANAHWEILLGNPHTKTSIECHRILTYIDVLSTSTN
jgi:hypothetical protein